MARLAAVLLWCVTAATPLIAHDREALGMLEGAWTVEGFEDSYIETCSWFEARSHLVCHSESREAGQTTRGVSVFSWSAEKQRFLYYHYGSSGRAQAEDIFIEGTTLYGTSERQAGSELVRSHVTMSRQDDGSFMFVRQESRNGRPWKTVATVHYLRVHPKTETQ